MGNRNDHYLPWENRLQVAAGAGAKVAPNGALLPFYGNTVIFDLDETAKDNLKHLQDRLYQTCGHFLSEKLTAESFHVTLHDLLNGTDRDEILVQMRQISNQAKQAVEGAGKLLDSTTSMKPVKLVNMVSTSVVLLLDPVYPVNSFLLNAAYEKLQEVVPLSYGFTPHVTLGYYRPGTIEGEDLQLLADTLSELSEQLAFTVALKSKNLRYCEFYDMNHYVEAIE